MIQALRVSVVKRTLWLVLAILLAGWRTYAQAPAWQTALATATGTITVQANTLKSDGTAVYLVGSFSSTATFGSTTLTTTNPQEAFVAKWSLATNSFAWAIQGTGTGTGSNSTNAVTTSGAYLFVAGNFSSATWQLGTPAALANAQAGTSDIFLARLADNGSSVAVSSNRRAGGTGNDYANAVVFTSTLITYVGGSTSGNATFGTSTMAGAGGFVAGYYAGNNPTPASAPVPMGSAVTALAYVAATNGLYAAGNFSSTAATFVDASHTLASAGSADVFVARLGNLSSLVPTYGWAQRAGGTGADYARAVLPSGTSVYVAGSLGSATATFGSTTLTNTGAGALFVAKLADTSTAGTFAWAVQNGGGTNAANSANVLATYGTSVYVAGAFGGTATFGGSTLTSAGGSDVLLAKLTDGGGSAAFVWGQQAGGAGADNATGLLRLGAQLSVTGQVTTPATFGSLSIGAAAGARPGFVATLLDTAPQLTLCAPNIGPVGTAVTLYGTGLAGTTAITFAGTSNNVVTSGFTVNAAGTQITGVVVPGGAQSGPVNATSPLGSSNGLVSFTVQAATAAPAWQSVAVAGSASYVYLAQPDASGNVVVAGSFSGSLTLGGTTLTSAGGTDLFVAKFNPATSTYVWAQRAGSSDNDSAYGLVVQGSSIYVAGLFNGPTATFGSTTLTTTYGYAGYVAKLTDAGNTASYTWAQLVDDGSTCFVESLAVSGTSVYIGGDYTGTTLTLGNGTLTGNASGDDGFIAKFTDNGSTASFVWAKGIGSTTFYNTINVYGIVARGSTVYLAGVFYGTVSFGSYSLTSSGPSDVAVARLADAGSTASFTGALRTGSSGDEWLYSMVGQGTALYLAGYSSGATWPGAVATGAGLNDAFVTKITDTGTTLTQGWVQLLGGTGEDEAYQLAVNGTGVYVAGYFGSPATFGSTTLYGAGARDAFVARLADAGSSVSAAWVQAAGGLASDGAYALALSPGKVYVGGSTTPLSAFGPQVYAAPAGVSAAFLASLNDASVLAAAPAATAARPGLYPNPAHGTVTVQLPAGGTTGLSLLDVMGREVRRYPAATGTEAALDLQGVPAGLYVLRGAGSTGQKLAVE